MTTTLQQVAEAFSSHRFGEAIPHLAAEVRWVSVGQSTLEGREAVVKACQDAAADMAGVRTEFTRFLSVASNDAVAVDAIARYVEDGGNTSVVSSCDIYEFDDAGLITTITSYAVELPAL